jgi:glycosyltransferase involved in cell wall biosynthesis
MLSKIAPFCQYIELVPFEGFPTIGKWRNRIQGWYQILCRRRPRCANTFPLARMRPVLREFAKKHMVDVVIFEFLLIAELSTELKGLPKILVEHNVESDIKKRALQEATNPIHKLRDWLTWRKLLRFEKEWVQRFPVCVAVSERDAERLREMAPQTEFHVVPNGVDVQHFAPEDSIRDVNTLLFFGTLNYGPNVEGLLWFCDEIWPKIRSEKPIAKLEVVGLDPSPRVLELDRLPGVQVTGFVPDIRSKLWSATVCVVPLRVGGGTRLKILEALAAGCPVVSTTVGAEGLAVINEEHLLIRDKPKQFAEGVAALLESERLRKELAKRGRELVEQQYDWQQIGSVMEAACDRAVQLHNASNGREQL